MEGKLCSICGGPHARAFRVSGLLLRHVCEECFVSRCIHCGAPCLDDAGRLLKGTATGIYHALYCKDCSWENMEKNIMKNLPPSAR
jgi:hypothetical protein